MIWFARAYSKAIWNCWCEKPGDVLGYMESSERLPHGRVWGRFMKDICPSRVGGGAVGEACMKPA